MQRVNIFKNPDFKTNTGVLWHTVFDPNVWVNI